MTIPFLYDENLLPTGNKLYIGIDFDRHPQMLVVGSTGSGKTYYQKLLLGKISKYLPDAEVTLCDFKNHDFVEFTGCPRHYGYENCVTGLRNF